MARKWSTWTKDVHCPMPNCKGFMTMKCAAKGATRNEPGQFEVSDYGQCDECGVQWEDLTHEQTARMDHEAQQ